MRGGLVLLLLLLTLITCLYGRSSRDRERRLSSRRDRERRLTTTTRNRQDTRRLLSGTRYGTRRPLMLRRLSGGGSRWSQASVWTAGNVYGSRAYMRRRRYHNKPFEEPTVCKNSVKPVGGAVYFVCPMENQDETMEECCGYENEQRCCKEDSLKTRDEPTNSTAQNPHSFYERWSHFVIGRN